MATERGGSGLEVAVRQPGPIPLDLAFTCPPGEVLALFGPSGSGKTTVLRAIAGLYRPASATITCGGEAWADTARGTWVPPHRRAAGLVFQDYALFPHLTVAGNVGAALGHRPRAERAGRVRDLLGLVHLGELAARYPAQLSGGQRQRVALARALARDPAVLLLDEPFAAIDRPLRASLYAELEAVRQALRVPIVLVTHDSDEVARLADRVVIIERGAPVAAGAVFDVLGADAGAALGGGPDPGTLLPAQVARHHPDRGLTRLTFAGGELWSPRLDIPAGRSLRIRIPAREVALCLERPVGLSTHNVLAAEVASIAEAPDPALALVRLRLAGAGLLSLVTRDAVSRLGLVPGTPVYALVKSVAVLRAG